MTIPFAKYEGLGNDFIVIERVASSLSDEGREQDRALAERLCDRHFGIGADGVLFVEARDTGAPSMFVINSDGSIPEMCGNGLRCVALHYARQEDVPSARSRMLSIDTMAGPHACEITFPNEKDEDMAWISVQMAVPSLDPARIPVALGANANANVDTDDAPWIDRPVTIDGLTTTLTAVSMGNPHAVLFDEAFEDRVLRTEWAPKLQAAPLFPNGVNVGFARSRGAGEFTLDVLERGAGWTLACGTGACAAGVAAVATGRSEPGQTLTFHLPGGPLEITPGLPGERVLMRGPARRVFTGSVPEALAT